MDILGAILNNPKPITESYIVILRFRITKVVVTSELQHGTQCEEKKYRYVVIKKKKRLYIPNIKPCTFIKQKKNPQLKKIPENYYLWYN